MGNCMRTENYISDPNKLTPSNSLSLKYELGNNLRKTLKTQNSEKKLKQTERFHRNNSKNYKH